MYLEIIALTVVGILSVLVYGWWDGFIVTFFFVFGLIGLNSIFLFIDIFRNKDNFEEILKSQREQERQRGGLR